MTPYYDREEWPGFLSAIRANPADDLPRLVAADWMEENGEAERAEFVRLQIRMDQLRAECWCGGCRKSGQHHNGTCAIDRERKEMPDGSSRQAFLRMEERTFLGLYAESWGCGRPDTSLLLGNDTRPAVTFRRGFVSRVRAPLAVLCGERCDVMACNGTGRNSELRTACTDCHGTGRTPGVLRELLRREPLGAEGIEVSDRDPRNGSPHTEIGWVREGEDVEPRDRTDVIPAEVFDLLGGGSDQWDYHRWMKYPTESAARLALSRAVYAVCSG